ncbi:ABC transporter permease [Parabacteroides sp. PF5-9]|uniref:ABC transporter permease n=1 Tax=Parabacteroides sp. PF5-9 TaxID=1742404 RepID=UPI00247351F5|nr:ABC transporter permease [Parabacteroides sp. PF5-9]MDH6356401.1 putative ABC transport system permease protein [Parabacteroides sp. PF5-9]
MFDIDRWVEIWVTITRNKTRSLLTCFGVFWGILMLIILLGSGTGMKNGILGNFKGFATNSLFFYTDRTSEPYKGFNKGRMWQMRNRDIESITQNVAGIEDISPIIWGNSGDKNIVYGQLTGSYNVKGVLPDYFNIESQELHYGRLLNEIDIQEKRKVCLIGTKVNETLFRNQDPTGKYIRVNGLYYQVVGVVKARSSSINIGGRSEESVFLPFSTMQQTLNQGDILHFLCVSVKLDYPVQEVIDEISAVLKTQNEIAPSDPQAVGIVNLAAQFSTFTMLFAGIDILVWLVGMGTLLAGIIGVSNIMMVTVKERTKEIGVRRALGAKPFNIISQVMSESLVLTALAGLLGLSLGVFLLDVVNKLLTTANASQESTTFFENPEVNIQTAIAATVVLLFSGLLAGLIPAWRAMQIKAIDAIREE